MTISIFALKGELKVKILLVCIFFVGYTFNIVPVTGMQNGDEASPGISSAGRGILVKMFITFEPHGIFLFD